MVPREQGTGGKVDSGRGVARVASVIVAKGGSGSASSVVAIIEQVLSVPVIWTEHATMAYIQCWIHRSCALVLDPRKRHQQQQQQQARTSGIQTVLDPQKRAK
jgi:hypothetical protein